MLSIFRCAPVCCAAKHPHSMIMLPPCFTVGKVFFRLKVSRRNILSKGLQSPANLTVLYQSWNRGTFLARLCFLNDGYTVHTSSSYTILFVILYRFSWTFKVNLYHFPEQCNWWGPKFLHLHTTQPSFVCFSEILAELYKKYKKALTINTLSQTHSY